MLKNSIVVLLFIVLVVLGGIYGQLLTVSWTYLIDVISRYWIPILVAIIVIWFVKDRSTNKKKS